MVNYKKQLKEIIRKEKWLMEILRSVRELNLPDWYIGAGAIRNTVWDVLHGYKKRTPLNDIDVIYFDKKGLSKETEEKYEKILSKKFPKTKIDVTNQAAVHTWKKNSPVLKSSEDGLSRWSETPTCIGIRLEKNGELTICAPHGLKDLMTLKIRKIVVRDEPELFESRIRDKKWLKRWPKLKVFY